MRDTDVLGVIAVVELELFPGGAKQFLSSHQARALIATIKKEISELVVARGSTLMNLTGIGPSGAARLLADVGDIHRFANRDRFASWNGTAPLDASSGDQKRHRLSRAGNRRINRALHIMAVVQLHHPTEGRTYFDAKRQPGRPRWKRCGHSNGDSPTSSTRRCSRTRNEEKRRAREGTRGRLCNPA